MPEKYRNNRPKANKATERKDDFVASNGTHFSAIAMSATFEQGNEGDDEYWGWSVNDTALRLSSDITEEPNIQSLEQSLTEARARANIPILLLLYRAPIYPSYMEDIVISKACSSSSPRYKTKEDQGKTLSLHLPFIPARKTLSSSNVRQHTEA